MAEEFSLFFFKQKTAYEMSASLVGSEMCIRDRICLKFPDGYAITIFSSGNFSATGFKDIKNLKQSLDFLVSLQTNWECMRDFRML